MSDALLVPWTQALGPGPQVQRAGEDLLGRWAEPHRGYHDREHLGEVLQALRLLTGGDVPRPVLLAAYWHDAVYEGTPEDEERSAALAASVLAGLDVPAAEVDEVVRLVRLTVTHDPAPGDLPGALLSDADLAVLAAPPARYRAYVEGVRREHAHLDDEAFRTGRARVLRVLAGRPALFRTPEAARRWEQPARRNLAAELAAAPPP